MNIMMIILIVIIVIKVILLLLLMIIIIIISSSSSIIIYLRITPLSLGVALLIGTIQGHRIEDYAQGGLTIISNNLQLRMFT